MKEKTPTIKERAEHNLCNSCGKILYGLTMCECPERMQNNKLWSKPPRNSEKTRKECP